MKERIFPSCAVRTAHRVLPPVGTAYDEDHTVIVCPVCECKTLDNHDICRVCGWEYDGFPEDHYSAANGATLADYREQYKRITGMYNRFGSDGENTK